MKKVDINSQLPSFSNFKKAIYRLIGRSLIFMQGNEKSYLAEHLCVLSYYWPKDTNYQSEILIEALYKIQLNKIVELLKVIHLK
jgi:hypothetical protein